MRKVVQVERIEGRGQVTWLVTRTRSGRFVAACDPLGITIQSDTWVDLMDDIAHALNALFVDLLQEGELDRFMRDRGFRLIGPPPSAPDDTWFDVPFSATMASGRDLETSVR